jgi:hypothetical protein
MNQEPKFSDDMLNTEGGMFLIEITNTIGEAEELIEISTVGDEIKEKCRVILRELLRRTELEKERTDPYDVSRATVVALLDLLGTKDDEQHELFKSLRGVILKARDSVKGWKA